MNIFEWIGEPKRLTEEEMHDRIDRIELMLAESGASGELPLEHAFYPGLYTRTVRVPGGVLLVTKIHRTEHPFVMTKGRCKVWEPAKGLVALAAPYMGRTMPGTRRVIWIEEDVEWTTFHATTETDLQKLEEQILSDRKNPLLEGVEYVKGYDLEKERARAIDAHGKQQLTGGN